MDESHSFSARSARTRPRSIRPIVAVALASFVLGAVLTFALASGEDWSFGTDEVLQLRSEETAGDTAQGGEPGEASPAPEPTRRAAQEARQAARRVEQVAETQGGIDQRVAAMEQRLTRLDLQAQAAAGNAARAEGLLIAFAARRAIERGARLGYLADQLRLRFGDALPNAVGSVIETSEDPVTLDQLLARLDGLAPALSQLPSDEGMLARIGRELSRLFIVRREETPSPRAQNRLERARLFLESGRIESAVAEIRNMPGAPAAADWISDAERYARVQRALELIETTAILEPRELRDASGNRVEQPSPAG